MKYLKLFENFQSGERLEYLLDKLKQFNLEKGDYAVFGSALSYKRIIR